MMRAVVATAIALFALVACGGATTSSEPGEPRDGGAAEAAEADAGFTIRDGAKCCAERTGRQCCAPDESFGACAAYGGSLDHCSGAGEGFPAKVPCAICCPGTRRIAITEVAPDGSCTFGSGDSLRCAPCGDGLCDPSAGENRCSCPMDCP